MSRSPRQEFPASAAREIKARAFDCKAGVYRCEGADCGCVVSIKDRRVEGAPTAHVDHTNATWKFSATPVKERPPLTAKDGKLLCTNCHEVKSSFEAGERKRCDGAAKIHAAHLAAMETKCIGAVDMADNPKRTWPTHQLKGRGFPTKEERQLFKKGYHHETT